MNKSRYIYKYKAQKHNISSSAMCSDYKKPTKAIKAQLQVILNNSIQNSHTILDQNTSDSISIHIISHSILDQNTSDISISIHRFTECRIY